MVRGSPITAAKLFDHALRQARRYLWAFLDEAAHPAAVMEGALVVTGDEESLVVARVLRLEDRPGGRIWSCSSWAPPPSSSEP